MFHVEQFQNVIRWHL